MAVKAEVQVNHSQHLFEVTAPSVVELPVVGNSITCAVCGKKNSIVTKVGVPQRVGTREGVSKSEGQKSILEKK